MGGGDIQIDKTDSEKYDCTFTGASRRSVIAR